MSILKVHEHGDLVEVVLNRPEKINALNFPLFDALIEAFETYDEKHPSKAIILRGEGERGFCSGGDVDEMLGVLAHADTEQVLQFGHVASKLILSMRHCPKPIIALLHGAVTGGGAAMALAADIRIASPDMRMAFMFTKIGMSAADMGVTFLLPRLVGFSRASSMLLTGEFIGVEQAHNIGLVHRVVERGALIDDGKALAQEIMQAPSFAMAMTKRMLNTELSLSLSDALNMESHSQTLCMQHPAFRSFVASWQSRKQKKG